MAAQSVSLLESPVCARLLLIKAAAAVSHFYRITNTHLFIFNPSHAPVTLTRSAVEDKKEMWTKWMAVQGEEWNGWMTLWLSTNVNPNETNNKNKTMMALCALWLQASRGESGWKSDRLHKPWYYRSCRVQWSLANTLFSMQLLPKTDLLETTFLKLEVLGPKMLVSVSQSSTFSILKYLCHSASSIK